MEKMKQNEQNNQEYAFIREKIKNKPINKKRLIIQGLWTVLFAMIFGAISCFIFVLLEPSIRQLVHPQEDPEIVIPKDEERLEDKEEQKTEDETIEELPLVPPITEVMELNVEDYQKLQNQLYDIGKDASKFIVTVTGIKRNTDIFLDPISDTQQACGIISNITNSQLLILTDRKGITDVDDIQVTFVNGDTKAAKLKNYDGNTGLAVISVSRNDISEETISKIEQATLGNSRSINLGTVVMAIGNGFISNGTVISAEKILPTYDSNYNVLTTNINGNKDTNGVLLNIHGEVIGLLIPQYNYEIDQNTLTALSISELKDLIEKLLKNMQIPFMGLKVTTVTDEIAERQQIPKGVYINSVVMDSAAMLAGIQDADVIIKINGEDISTSEQYTQKVMEMTPEQTLTVTVMRQNIDGYKELDFEVVLGRLDL